jgi:hypothetical protein
MSQSNPLIVDFQFIQNNTDIVGGMDNALINQSTGQPAVYPATSMLRAISLHATSPLTSGAQITLGVVGNNTAFLDAAKNITTDDVNAADILICVGQSASYATDQNIVINTGATTVSGQIQVYFEYNTFMGLP